MEEEMIGMDDAERVAERHLRGRIPKIISIDIEKQALQPLEISQYMK